MSKRHISKPAIRTARWALPVVGATLALALTAAPAAACGGLVGENGTIQLTRTTTLAAYHNGIERYVTLGQTSSRVSCGRCAWKGSRSGRVAPRCTT